MNRATALLVGIAALAMASSAADARDGCGRGMFYDGYGCRPEGYAVAPRYYGGPQYYQQRRYYREPQVQYGRRGPASCGNPNYTVQDGVCKPYRGP